MDRTPPPASPSQAPIVENGSPPSPPWATNYAAAAVTCQQQQQQVRQQHSQQHRPATHAGLPNNPQQQHQRRDNSGNQRTRASLPHFSRTDLALISTSLMPREMQAWRPILQARLQHKADSVEEYRGIAQECFEWPSSAWENACAEPSDRGERRTEFNAWLAEGLHGGMVRESPQVVWLRHILGRIPGAMLDGRLMLDHIASLTYGASAAELQQRELDFESREYFTDEMTGPEMRAAYTEFSSEHKLLPEHARGGAYKIHHDLLAKLPPSCATMAEKRTRQLFEEQALGMPQPRLSLEQILDLAVVATQHRRKDLIAHVLTRDEPQLNDPRLIAAYAAGNDRTRSNPRIRPSPRAARGCSICGEPGHSHFDCSATCRTCDMRRCPGSRRGQKCIIHQSERPRNVTDALGQQISAEGYADLLHAWRKQNPSAAGNETRARREAQSENRSVRYADDQSHQDGGSEAYEDYGVMAADEKVHERDTMPTYDRPQGGYSDSDEEYYMGVVSMQSDCLSRSEPPSVTQAHGPPTLELTEDSGAGLHIFQTTTMRAAVRELSPREADALVSGIGFQSHAAANLEVRLSLDGGVHMDQQAPFIESNEGGGAARDIMSTAVQCDELRFTTHPDQTPRLRAPTGTCVPSRRRGRHYWLRANVEPTQDMEDSLLHQCVICPASQCSALESKIETLDRRCKAALCPEACANTDYEARSLPTRVNPRDQAPRSRQRALALLASPPLATSAPAWSHASLDKALTKKTSTLPASADPAQSYILAGDIFSAARMQSKQPIILNYDSLACMQSKQSVIINFDSLAPEPHALLTRAFAAMDAAAALYKPLELCVLLYYESARGLIGEYITAHMTNRSTVGELRYRINAVANARFRDHENPDAQNLKLYLPPKLTSAFPVTRDSEFIIAESALGPRADKDMIILASTRRPRAAPMQHLAPQPQPALTAHDEDHAVVDFALIQEGAASPESGPLADSASLPVLTKFSVEFTCLELCNYNIRHTLIQMDADNPVVMLARAVYHASKKIEPGMPPVTGISARCGRKPVDLSNLRRPIREVVAIENGEAKVSFRLHMPIGSDWIQQTRDNLSLASTVPAYPSPAHSEEPLPDAHDTAAAIAATAAPTSSAALVDEAPQPTSPAQGSEPSPRPTTMASETPSTLRNGKRRLAQADSPLDF